MAQDDKKKELENIVLGINGFKRSGGGPWTYKAERSDGKIVAVQFTGEELEVCEGKGPSNSYRTLNSTPLSGLNTEKVKPCLENILNNY